MLVTLSCLSDTLASASRGTTRYQCDPASWSKKKNCSQAPHSGPGADEAGTLRRSTDNRLLACGHGYVCNSAALPLHWDEVRLHPHKRRDHE